MLQDNQPTTPALVARAGLASLLGVSEATTRNLEATGEISPAMIVGNRPLFSTAAAVALRARRDADRAAREAKRKQRVIGRRPEGSEAA